MPLPNNAEPTNRSDTYTKRPLLTVLADHCVTPQHLVLAATAVAARNLQPPKKQAAMQAIAVGAAAHAAAHTTPYRPAANPHPQLPGK